MRQLTCKTNHNNLLKGEGKMKTILRFSTVFFAMALVLTLVPGKSALAQVSSFPYGYGWTGASAVSGDGNWSTSRSSSSAPYWAFSATGGNLGAECVTLAGFHNGYTSARHSYLVLALDFSGEDLNGTETLEFYVRRDQTGAATGTLTVEYSANGTSWTQFTGASYDLRSTFPNGVYTQVTVTFPATGLDNDASVWVRIQVTPSSSSNNTDPLRIDDVTIQGEALPIQMASFAANVVRNNDVEVAWKTVSETNNYGFEIYRKRGDAGDWTNIGFVEGHGTTLAAQSYSYLDRSLPFGTYYYQIKQVDLDGKSETFPLMTVNVGVAPERLTLGQNYPNPFNPSTVIEFVVPMSGHATMKVYNVLGQEVATLFDGNAEAGRINSTRFDASNLPSGLYFYTLKSAGTSETKRMLLMK
jgi:hypothetical protein